MPPQGSHPPLQSAAGFPARPANRNFCSPLLHKTLHFHPRHMPGCSFLPLSAASYGIPLSGQSCIQFLLIHGFPVPVSVAPDPAFLPDSVHLKGSPPFSRHGCPARYIHIWRLSPFHLQTAPDGSVPRTGTGSLSPRSPSLQTGSPFCHIGRFFASPPLYFPLSAGLAHCKCTPLSLFPLLRKSGSQMRHTGTGAAIPHFGSLPKAFPAGHSHIDSSHFPQEVLSALS